jgi:hypothetical protein
MRLKSDCVDGNVVRRILTDVGGVQLTRESDMDTFERWWTVRTASSIEVCSSAEQAQAALLEWRAPNSAP